ncbi:MAG TPA: acyl-CoA dehydrogenase [Kofleriaceae bacterium]|nr:acyl-CoA dehydrogenase [Kofleriaceae bacterium]
MSAAEPLAGAAIPRSTDDLGLFFDEEHRALAARLREAAPALLAAEALEGDERARDRAAVSALAAHGLFELVAPPVGGVSARSLCLARELLGWISPRADSIFAVQGLGTHALRASGSAEQRAALPAFATGRAIAAFALTEPEAGSDVAALATEAAAVDGGRGYRLDGEKVFISNLGLASHAIVFATVDRAAGRRAITAFWLPLDTDGVEVVPQEPIAAHPLGRLVLRGAVVGRDAVIGAVGDGFKLAMQTLDTFRVSVAAAAVGMARRALDEAARHVRARRQFGKPLAEQPLVFAHLADMATSIDASRLLTLRAAHLRDHGAARATVEVSMAKLHATEAAQDVIDRAVQLLGGRGVMRGAVVEHLYRAIRPLRIYEGTSEIQRTIIGRAIAAEPQPRGGTS